MIVDLISAGIQGGLGDAVMFSHLLGVSWNCSPKQAEIFKLFNRPVVTAGGIRIDKSYLAEIRDKGRKCRLDYVRRLLPEPVEIEFPTHNLTERELYLAKRKLDAVGRPACVLFPTATRIERTYPLNRWLDVDRGLREKGIYPVWLGESIEPDVYKFTGLEIREVVALVAMSDMVLGCESFGSSIGGALRKKVTCLVGPSNPAATGIWDIQYVNGGGCSGCHWGKPYRPACKYGCLPLQGIDPDFVVNCVDNLWQRGYKPNSCLVQLTNNCRRIDDGEKGNHTSSSPQSPQG